MKNNNNFMELQPIYNSQKSFYGKAWVVTEGNIKKLVSYHTTMASYNMDTGEATILSYYLSSTTLKHLKEFFLQATGKDYCKRDYLKALEDNKGVLL